MRMFAAAAAALSLALSAGSALALDGWERLGQRTVEFRGDVDTIPVGRGDGMFRRLMFEVDGGAVEVWNVRVVFGNGGAYSPPTRLTFGDDTRSRVIDLPGQARFIRTVTFNYRSLRTGQGRANVTLYGQ
jgi:hypothetical protein